jgi:hypothetical protein
VTVVFVHVLSFDSGTRQTSSECTDSEVSELLRSKDTASYGERTQFLTIPPGKPGVVYDEHIAIISSRKFRHASLYEGGTF